MTQEQFTEKFQQLLTGVYREVEAEGHRLFSNGKIAHEDFGNDFALPKIIATVALRHIADGYRPLSFNYRHLVQELMQQ